MSLTKIFVSISVIFIVAGCNWREDKVQPFTQPVSQKGLFAFEKSVYAYAQANCKGCHGEKQQPRFAQPNVEEAYRLARLYVDFANIPNSTFVIRTMNGHCGTNCQTDGSAMRAAIGEWWENGEKDNGTPTPNTGLTTPPVALTELSLGGAFEPFQWDLTGMGEGVRGAKFRVEVQRFDATSYRLRKPRLIVGDANLLVDGIHFSLNGVSDPTANMFAGVRVEVSTGAAPPVLSAKNLVLAGAKGAGDQLAVTFNALKAMGPVTCRNEALFSETVYPVLASKCFRCHTRPGGNATARFPMDGEDAEVCLGARMRGYLGEASESAVIQYPLVQANNHPSRAIGPEEASIIEAWLKTEFTK